uniref:Uncharacterized protein n=1 Tax=Lactuca sativa TaxID=4236 RepID=A0A9R1VL45_LACSA|nr:hypothetical protein LSAT_V11C400196640 [Lactuca sativa]
MMLPCPTRYALSDPLLKLEVERNKNLLKKKRKRMERGWMLDYDGCLVRSKEENHYEFIWVPFFYLQKNVPMKHIQDNTCMSMWNLVFNNFIPRLLFNDPLLKLEVERNKILLKKKRKRMERGWMLDYDGCLVRSKEENHYEFIWVPFFYLQKNVPMKHIQDNTCMSMWNLVFNNLIPRLLFKSSKESNHIHLRSPQNLGDDEKLHQQKGNYLTGSHDICFRLSNITKFEQLRHMLSSNEREECKLSECLKVFSPLVKVLRMVDADWKPSMGFVYGEIQIEKEEIIKSLGGNEKHYKPIIDIINTKMKGRLDSTLHLTSYLLNPYYHYNDTQLQFDPDVMDAVLDFFDTLFLGDLEMQRQVITIDMPKYKKMLINLVPIMQLNILVGTIWWNNSSFDKDCNEDFSLTSSSLDYERNWSTFEGVHTKKRNRLQKSKLNNLVYVQFNTPKRLMKLLQLMLVKHPDEVQKHENFLSPRVRRKC